MYDYLIVGAGFSGSVFAERIASQLNKEVLVVEKEVILPVMHLIITMRIRYWYINTAPTGFTRIIRKFSNIYPGLLNGVSMSTGLNHVLTGNCTRSQ